MDNNIPEIFFVFLSYTANIHVRTYMLLHQRSKLRPFWSPWRVEKNFGDQNSSERVMATILQLKVAFWRLFKEVSLERCTCVWAIDLERATGLLVKCCHHRDFSNTDTVLCPFSVLKRVVQSSAFEKINIILPDDIFVLVQCTAVFNSGLQSCYSPIL